MKTINRDDDDVNRVLEKYHLPPPSEALRAQVLAAAHDAWESNTPETTSWHRTVVQLILTTAAAIAIIWGANIASSVMISPWQENHDPVASKGISHPLEDDWLATPHRLMTGNTRPRPVSAKGLYNYTQQLQKALDNNGRNTSEQRAIQSGQRLLFNLRNQSSQQG